MSDKNTVTSLEQEKALPTGQWVIDDSGAVACLFDTHMGWPQRMWGLKADGGTKGRVTSFTRFGNLQPPLRLADLAPDVECKHLSANECGQCLYCGRPEASAPRHVYMDAADLKIVNAVAKHNSELGEQR